jgi:1-aminocyclopropane-1-carboxylate deaminase/D-cysteine desulfhydrase-like pyridoxal-dependent ACC family enzyme
MREIRQSVVITVDAIASNDALANNVAVWARGSRLYVRVDKPEMIEVYTSAGALCLQRIAGNDMSIPLPRGIYIVKLGDKRYKVALN